MYNKLEKPIPFSDLPDTSVIGHNEKAEGFVDINEYSDGRIKVSMQYFEAGLNGSINKALVRKGVADRLLKALKLLPEGYTFEILDAWRPYDVQLSLFNGYYNQIKEANPDIEIWAVEPEDAAILSGGSIGTHLQMGIGDGLIPAILNTEIYSDICIIKDEEALSTAKTLALKEGILCGISSGTNVAAAMKLAKKLGKGKTVVTVLPDTAERYFSTPLFEE